MGLTRCVYCEGQGKVPCRRDEKRADTGDDTKSHEGCERCQGTGREPCRGCAGGGYVDMPTLV